MSIFFLLIQRIIVLQQGYRAVEFNKVACADPVQWRNFWVCNSNYRLLQKWIGWVWLLAFKIHEFQLWRKSMTPLSNKSSVPISPHHHWFIWFSQAVVASWEIFMMHGSVFDINTVRLITQIHKTVRLKTLFGSLGPIFEIIFIIQKQTKRYIEWNHFLGGRLAFIFHSQ